MATIFLRMCSSFLEFCTVEAYSGLGLTGGKYNINQLSRVEKE